MNHFIDLFFVNCVWFDPKSPGCPNQAMPGMGFLLWYGPQVELVIGLPLDYSLKGKIY